MTLAVERFPNVGPVESRWDGTALMHRVLVGSEMLVRVLRCGEQETRPQQSENLQDDRNNISRADEDTEKMKRETVEPLKADVATRMFHDEHTFGQ